MNLNKILLFFLFVSFSSGCASVIVKTKGSVSVSEPATDSLRTEVVNLGFLGIKAKNRNDKSESKDYCAGAPPAEVIITKGFWRSLVGVFTLGLYQPVKITYTCNEPCN